MDREEVLLYIVQSKDGKKEGDGKRTQGGKEGVRETKRSR